MGPRANPQAASTSGQDVTTEAANLDPSALRTGDPRALEAVYWAFVDQVAALVRRGFVYSRDRVVVVPGVGEPQAQLDLIQETFLRLFSEQARRAYDPQRPLRPYLLRIAKNLMIDRLRRSGREVNAASDGLDSGVGDIDALLDEDGPIPAEDPASLAHWHRQREATRAWASRLATELKAIYDLRYERSLGQELSAERLGISRRRVRTLEARLRRCLRKELKKKGLWP